MPDAMKCPFCGGPVRIVVVDGVGNLRPGSYEADPWSGLGFCLAHHLEDELQDCPIATHPGELVGARIYESRDEAAKVFAIRAKTEAQKAVAP